MPRYTLAQSVYSGDRCYYDSGICHGHLWECETCSELYCSTHFHENDLGFCVECVACEYERKEADPFYA